MANKKNLIPQAHVLTVEDQSKGGKASAQKRKEKKLFKDALLTLLESENGRGKNYQDTVVVGLVKRAATGDPRAVELLLRIIGEAPDANMLATGNLLKARELLGGIPDGLDD